MATRRKFAKITVPPPGPKAQEVRRRILAHHSPSVGRRVPFVYADALGALVRDPDGNTYLDFVANYEATGLGHCDPRIVEAIQSQAQRLVHGYLGFGSELVAELGEALVEILPGDLSMIMLMNSGSEGVETALKLSRYYTKRHLFIGFEWGFHGRMFGGLHLTGTGPQRRKGFEPILPGVIHAPFPYTFRSIFGPDPKVCTTQCLRYLRETVLGRVAPADDIAAIVVEPIPTQGGVLVPPDGWLQGIRELCSSTGILMVTDEVGTGMGRTGRILASEHWGVLPDVVVLAGGLGGVPLSVVASAKEIMTSWPMGSHGTTFGGNALSSAAALATIRALREDNLLAHVEVLGEHLSARLHDMADRFPIIGEVRGKGLLAGIELVKDRTTHEPAEDAATRLAYEECFPRGLLIMKTGTATLKLCPPLTISQDELDEGLDILEEGLAAL